MKPRADPRVFNQAFIPEGGFRATLHGSRTVRSGACPAATCGSHRGHAVADPVAAKDGRTAASHRSGGVIPGSAWMFDKCRLEHYGELLQIDWLDQVAFEPRPI